MKKNAQRHWQGGAGRYTLDLRDLDQNSEGGNYAIIDIETEQSIWEVVLGGVSVGSGWAPDLVGAQHAVEEWLVEHEKTDLETGAPTGVRPPLLGKKVKAMEEMDFDADWKDQREPPQDPDAGYEDWEEVQEKLFRYESPYGAEAYVKQLDKDKFIWTVWPEGIGKVEGPTGEETSFEDAKNKALSNMRGSKSFEMTDLKRNMTDLKRDIDRAREMREQSQVGTDKAERVIQEFEDLKKTLPPEVVQKADALQMREEYRRKHKIPQIEMAEGAPTPAELSQMFRLQKMIRQCGWTQTNENTWELDLGMMHVFIGKLTQGFMWEVYDVDDTLIEAGTEMTLAAAQAAAKNAMGGEIDLFTAMTRRTAAGTIPWKTFGALAFASIPGIGMAEVKWDVEKKTWVWFLSYKGQKHTGTAESQSEGQDIVAQKFESLSPVPVMAKVIRVDANGELCLRYKVGANVLLKGRPFTVVAAAPPGKAFARNGVRAPLLVSPEGSTVLMAVDHEELVPK